MPEVSNFCFLAVGSKAWLDKTPGPHRYCSAKV